MGRLSAAELEFLESRGATVEATRDGHSDTLYRMIDQVRDGRLQLIAPGSTAVAP